jgi:hypothetical protein
LWWDAKEFPFSPISFCGMWKSVPLTVIVQSLPTSLATNLSRRQSAFAGAAAAAAAVAAAAGV